MGRLKKQILKNTTEENSWTKLSHSPCTAHSGSHTTSQYEAHRT